jgi:thiamine biosynthesis protein ThiI
VTVILVRYAEMGLKSRPVRQRFESILIDNMLDSLFSRGVEALVSSEYGRIYLRVDDTEGAVESISRVFGVASLSPVEECRAKLDEIGAVASRMSLPLIKDGNSFAVRGRREGVHDFTSMDLNREVGSAVWVANEDKNISVDLQDPDVEIFVEVRNTRAYVFHQIVPGPGGLPMGSQGKVLAFLSSERDALAAWMMMKRGCRVAIVTDEASLASGLRSWDVNLRVEPPTNLDYMKGDWGALGTVHGLIFDQIDEAMGTDLELPAFFPLIGMDEDEIERRLAAIE